MALILFSAAVLVTTAGIVLILRSRVTTGGALGAALQRVAGSFLLASVAIGFIVWGWATTATDTSQTARALLWGGPDTADLDRFPSRAVPAGPDVLAFGLNYQSAVVDTFDPTGGPTTEREPGFRSFLAEADTAAFVIVHRGDLVYEEYFAMTSRETLHPTFGVTATITGALAGIALGEGYIAHLDDAVSDYLPELARRDPRFSKISIRHLLTMSSGLRWDDGWLPWDDPADTYHGTDLRNAAVTQTAIERPPGQTFDYNDWNPLLLGMVIEERTAMSVSDYAAARLWQPMGAELDASWSLDSDESGFEKMFSGFNARAVDLARFGWIHANGGSSGATQVIPASFVAEATRADTTRDPAGGYQYLWWVDPATGAYYAEGDHCQYVYVRPDTQLVIVRLGSRCGGVDWLRVLTDLGAWLPSNLRSVSAGG